MDPKKSAEREEKTDRDMPIARPSEPRNAPPAIPKKQPSDGVGGFEVRTRGVESFRRCGIDFTPDAVLVEAKDLTREQAVELLNTETLHVVERKGGGKGFKDEPAAKAEDKK